MKWNPVALLQTTQFLILLQVSIFLNASFICFYLIINYFLLIYSFIYLFAAHSTIRNRYPDESTRERIRNYVLTTIRQHISSQTGENPRVVCRVLSAAASFKEVRMWASDFLEGTISLPIIIMIVLLEIVNIATLLNDIIALTDWLNNPAVMRHVRELVNNVVFFCKESCREDETTLTNILKLRVKGMHSQLVLEAVTQLLKNNPEYPVAGTD